MDFLIAALGVVAAVYSVLPRARRLDLRLRFGYIDMAVFASVLAIVGYLDLYGFFKAHHLAPRLPAWSVGLTPAEAQRIFLIFLIAFGALRMRMGRLSVRKIARFQRLVDELLWSRSFAELLDLLEAHLSEFFRIYAGNFWLRKARTRLTPDVTLVGLMRAGRERRPIRIKSTRLERALLSVLSLFPDREAEISIASTTARHFLLSSDFVQAMVRGRPYLGLQLIEHLIQDRPRFLREEFVELYFTELMSHRKGAIYIELENNRNLASSSRHRFALPSENRLIHFLFADIAVANKLEVWRPVGEFMLRELVRLARTPAEDKYNQACLDEKWEAESPLFVGVQFFDLMVSEALFQKLEWHMWLYYMPYVVNAIVRNYHPADDPLITGRGTNRVWYGHLLYAIFTALRNWIEAAQEVPTGQRNAAVDSTNPIHDNGSIPKSSILALGQCLHCTVSAPNLEQELQDELTDTVFGLYFELYESRDYGDFADALVQSIRSGGSEFGQVWVGDYRNYLIASVRRQDRVVHHEAMDALEAAFRKP